MNEGRIKSSSYKRVFTVIEGGREAKEEREGNKSCRYVRTHEYKFSLESDGRERKNVKSREGMNETEKGKVGEGQEGQGGIDI